MSEMSWSSRGCMLTMLLWWHTKLTEFGGSVDRPFPCLQGVQIDNNHEEDEYHDSWCRHHSIHCYTR